MKKTRQTLENKIKSRIRYKNMVYRIKRTIYKFWLDNSVWVDLREYTLWFWYMIYMRKWEKQYQFLIQIPIKKEQLLYLLNKSLYLLNH